MQTCQNCGRENMEGVVYCQQCGVALIPVPLSTRQFEEGSGGSGTDELSEEGVLLLQIGEEDFPMAVQLRQELILGRVNDPDNGITTHVDLSSYEGETKGVSRRHARLLREGKNVFVIDLGSTNGTHLNGEVLAPSIAKQIHDGDELMLGQLKLYVYFKK